MTKEELVETVNLVHAMWNKDLGNDGEKATLVYRAWGRLLKDCPQDGILQAAERLNMREEYLPTPGALKSEYQRTVRGAAPTPAQAWNQYVALRDAVNAGTHNPTVADIHPRLRKTIAAVGYSLSTNDDRRHFTATYWTMGDGE